MATYVLVPGFWLGAWAWDGVASELRQAGHEVHAVTLTGLAERADELSPKVDVDTHIADILHVIEGNDLNDVILVGHSGANMPVTGVADRIPQRLSRVVYIDSAPLPSGFAQIDFSEPEERAEVEAQVGDGFAIPVPPFQVGEHEFTEEHIALIREKATPEPYGAATQKLTRPDVLPSTPKTMIATSIPLPAVQGMIASGAPIFSALATPEWAFLELPTGHWPMFTRAAELAALLERLPV